MVTADDVRTCETCFESYRARRGEAVSTFAKRRFCSRPCSLKGMNRPGKPKRDRCRSEEHEMTGDNVRIDKRGRRTCKACASLREQERNRVRRRTRARPRPVPDVVPVVMTTVPKEAVVWRPAGWGPVQVRVGSVAS